MDSTTNLIDARGSRFGALITTVVLALSLLTHSTALITWQLVVFAIGALFTPRKTPYALIYKKFVAPHLKGEGPRENIRPPQFAQFVGFTFLAAATVGAFTQSWVVFDIATGFALFAAFLNAAFNLCLGCKIYLIGIRLIRS